MKAFIGRSFDEHDNQLVTKIVEFIESLDINCGDAKSAKNKTVEEKITELIEGCEIFVGIFTCDKPICKEEEKTKWYCKPRSETTIFTTSNWVIQESGFALGRNKKLILLKENGVCELPKLQGNLEYIPFDRNHLEDSFLKISQMISDIKTKASGGVTEKSSEGLSKPEEPKSEEQKEQNKEEIKDKKQELFSKIYVALWSDKDYKKAWTIFDEKAEAVLNEDDRINLRAFILKESHSLGDESAFEKLEKLAQEKKDKPRVIKQLAYRYKEIGEFKKAREKFLLAAEQYDATDTDKKEGLIEAYIQAAWCLAYDDDLNCAITMLRKLLFDPNFQDSKAPIFGAMAGISKDKNDIENFLFYAEAALDNDPVNTQLRFALAYEYSNSNNEKLALLHYKKLTDTIKHSAGLNNMGASYRNLELKGKSIRSYFKSAEEKNTLSMGNIAHIYVDAGFVDDAQNLIDKAAKLSIEGFQVNPRVGEAQNKIKTLLEGEEKKEEEILLEARKESQYRVKYSKVLCSDTKITKSQIEGTWLTPWGAFELTFDDATKAFSIKGHKKIEVQESAWRVLLDTKSNLNVPSVSYRERYFTVNGKIENLSGKYSIDVEDRVDPDTPTGKTYEATGYIVINEDCNCIYIMEKTKDGKTKIEQWKKQIKQ